MVLQFKITNPTETSIREIALKFQSRLLKMLVIDFTLEQHRISRTVANES